MPGYPGKLISFPIIDISYGIIFPGKEIAMVSFPIGLLGQAERILGRPRGLLGKAEKVMGRPGKLISCSGIVPGRLSTTDFSDERSISLELTSLKMVNREEIQSMTVNTPFQIPIAGVFLRARAKPNAIISPYLISI